MKSCTKCYFHVGESMNIETEYLIYYLKACK